MGIDRSQLFWLMRDSKIPECEYVFGYSPEWHNEDSKVPLNSIMDLVVWYRGKEVLRINERSSFFHAMNLRASTSGDNLEVAIFGYFEGGEAIYLIMDESGTLLENSWFTDKAERFLPFKNLEC